MDDLYFNREAVESALRSMNPQQLKEIKTRLDNIAALLKKMKKDRDLMRSLKEINALFKRG